MMVVLLVFNEPLKSNASRGNQGIEVRLGCGGVWCYEHLPPLMSKNNTFITINPELSEWVSYDSDKRKCETQTSVTWSINSAALSAIQSALTHEMVTRECAIMFHNVTNILSSPRGPKQHAVYQFSGQHICYSLPFKEGCGLWPVYLFPS